MGEYIAWRSLDAEFDRLLLVAGRYRRVPADGGVIRRALFPGPWPNNTAVIAFDSTVTFATLRAGPASPEHAAFAADLARRRAAATDPPRP